MPDAIDGIANEFRLSRISSIRKELVDERDTRTILSKKYRKALKIVNSIHAVLLFTTSTLTVLGTLLPVPFAIPVIGTAGGIGGMCVIASQVSGKLCLRIRKHENIRILAESKLDSITDSISKALDDDNVSKEEYSSISGELEKFKFMKERIRKKTIAKETKRISIDGKLMRSLIKLFARK